MADRFDKSLARRPAADPQPRRDEATLPDDDPLVELARIVSGNESFDQILGSRYRTPAEPPRPAAQPRAQQPRDFSFDLEAELLNDLHSSFDPSARQAEPPARPAAPVTPRAVEPPRAQPQPRAQDDGVAPPIRTTAPVAPPRAVAPVAADEPYVAAPDFGRGRVPPEVSRRPAAPVQPPVAAGRHDADDAFEEDYLEDDGYEPYDDDDAGYVEQDVYEDEKPRRSRKLLITAGVVAAVVVVGGIGAYALMGRSSGGSSGTPQIIAADEGPTKVEPEVQPQATQQDTQQNKLIYDRADPNQGSPDQLAPADTNIATDTAQSNESEASREISRIILPGGPGDQSTAPAVPGAEDATDDSGPRKVRTVVVKPDGTIVSSEAAPRGATDTAPAATVPDNAPLPPSDAPPSMAANDMAPAGSDDTAPAASAPVGSAKDNSQLQPPSPPQPAETTVAAAPTVAPEPPPAAATAPPVTGGFVVQVTSQRSEQAAVAAFKNLQKKFPSVLGDRTPDIARADLGAKGVYFRARVGPMATRDEAVSFCEQLRAAGGDCIVQKN
ncbi:MAG: SPOR domain-containing protein [Bosea sp.]|nr:SPOR domain-containing protein [Bosea sp. (in: a-proteobacteria)]